jgi:hypothetical protein
MKFFAIINLNEEAKDCLRYIFCDKQEAESFLKDYREKNKKKKDAETYYSKALVRYDRIYRQSHKAPERKDIPNYERNPEYSEDVYNANMHVFNRGLNKFVEAEAATDISDYMITEGFSDEDVTLFLSNFTLHSEVDNFTIQEISVPEGTKPKLFSLLQFKNEIV